jgi:hypothetical protein
MTRTQRAFNAWAAGLAFATAVVLTPVAVSFATSSGPSKGPIPDAAFVPGQPIDKDQVPDFIPALDQAGIEVGYVDKNLAIPEGAQIGQDRDIPVYASDLKTVVGRMVPGKGFVPVGKPDGSVPDIQVTTGQRG